MRGELQHAVEQRILTRTTWMGVQTQKQPMDAWVYQEIIYGLRPDFIIEIGNHEGGSLLYLAHLCDLLGRGEVYGIDLLPVRDARVTQHPRISLVTGDALQVFDAVASEVGGRRVLVIEDSAHTYEHTLAVLRTYSQLVTVGSYLICEDGVMPDVARALEQFTGEQDSFVPDPGREWPVTWNPGGYLLRVR